jgi:hypothetical protein
VGRKDWLLKPSQLIRSVLEQSSHLVILLLAIVLLMVDHRHGSKS